MLTDGERILTVPRSNPVNAFTTGRIVQDAGLKRAFDEHRNDVQDSQLAECIAERIHAFGHSERRPGVTQCKDGDSHRDAKCPRPC